MNVRPDNVETDKDLDIKVVHQYYASEKSIE
jgi:hypothetical protein